MKPPLPSPRSPGDSALDLPRRPVEAFPGTGAAAGSGEGPLREVPPARAFRIARDLKLADLAKRAGLTPDYLRRVEREGAPNYWKGVLLGRVYGCEADLFLPRNSRQGDAGRSPRTRKPRAVSSPARGRGRAG